MLPKTKNVSRETFTKDVYSRFFQSQNVSRETFDKFAIYCQLLEKWQKRTNLISNSSFSNIWQRHFADSMQFFVPSAKNYIDLGTGAGFPGLIIACLLAEQNKSNCKIDLIESNNKKCAFLREIVRNLHLENHAVIHNGRIEDVLPKLVNFSAIDVIVARGLASLDSLLNLTYPHITGDIYGLFGKGKNYAKEIDLAKKKWDFSIEIIASNIENQSKLLKIKNVKKIKNS